MAAKWRGRREKSRARTPPKAIGSGRCRGSRIGSFETVSKLRRDELYESPIVRESLKKSGTRITRPSEHKVFETVSFRRKPSCFPRFPRTKRLRRCHVLFCGDGIYIMKGTISIASLAVAVTLGLLVFIHESNGPAQPVEPSAPAHVLPAQSERAGRALAYEKVPLPPPS